MKTVFTNGCFDILHRGHIELLQYCSSLGRVIVGLNSDASVKLLKGSARPIMSQSDRKLLLKSIRYVDDVIIFDEETPLLLIKTIKPDIIVKGGDYKSVDVVGSEFCEVRIFGYVEGKSTTEIIANLTDR